MPRELVTFYLEDGLRQNAEAGRHRFIGLMAGVLRGAGLTVAYAPDTPVERALAGARPGRAMFHMADPPGPSGLTFRRVYHYPFWQIERRAARWDWDVARAAFAPPAKPGGARRFYRFWQRHLFGDAPARARRDPLVYVPLQGLLREKRSFQTCSPLDMLRHVLDQVPDHEVLVGLHPKETYSRADRAALAALSVPRMRIVTGGMEQALERCDFVVTQNSSAAFNGYFFGKPAVLFAGIDFHHIAANVATLGVDGAFEAVRQMRPDYAGYLWWFWQRMSINAGREDAEEQIRARLYALGWPA
ncbi:hypothetical protein [Roseisalinus antarcticus]|uniref:Capsule polysaccharide biosynthesis protein n=1 Tax=Roseisalinus antarcticus TaxID=254357 RepID=A0A1Y5S3B2_9RHOB|nr:hypothetical protein [Roseisalinus antarcticus]SLN30673.1 hypothetical protein ROA7023_01051 [Roseisalinus antarcticus]